MNDAVEKTAWSDLGKEQQIRQSIDFGHHLDQLTPTCELAVKGQRLRDWLDHRDIAYPGDE